MFKAVGAFNEKFGLPVAGADGPPRVIDDALFLYKYGHLHEELHELLQAHARQDLPEIADALVDLVYVALGTAHVYGIPLDEVFAEVQRANLAKVRCESVGDIRSHRGHGWDVVKPAGWTPPDVAGVLRAAGWQGGSDGP